MQPSDHYIDYTKTDLKREFEECFFKSKISAEKYLKNYNPSGYLIFNYDTNKYPFRRLVANMIADSGLLSYDASYIDANMERLDDFTPVEAKAMDGSLQNRLSVSLYEQSSEFISTYKSFVKDCLKKQLHPCELFYQNTPTFRVYFPEKKGYEGGNSWHSDAFLGHPPHEMNFFIPITDADQNYSFSLIEFNKSREILKNFGSNFKQFGQKCEDQDFQNILDGCRERLTVKYGQAIIFDSRVLHAGIKIVSDTTRVSFDFRLLTQSDATNIGRKYVGTGRKKAVFCPGEYFSKNAV